MKTLLFLLGVPLALAAQPDEPANTVDTADAAQEDIPSAITVPRLESPVTDLASTLGSGWIASMQRRLLALPIGGCIGVALLCLPFVLATRPGSAAAWSSPSAWPLCARHFHTFEKVGTLPAKPCADARWASKV